MKYSAEVDMQEIPRQISPLTQVQNNMHGIPDRSNWRSKHLELSNSNGTKNSPEIIDLDSEESPVKEILDNAIAVNGVTTTVKKVSLPWQDKVSTDEAKKSIPTSQEEDDLPRKPPCENSAPKESMPSSEAVENTSPVVSEGGRMSKKKSFSSGNSQVMKGPDKERKVVETFIKSPDIKRMVVSDSVKSKVPAGERKRPSPEDVDDGSSKKLRTADFADESLAKSTPAANEVNGLAVKDTSKSQVSLVDLVDEEEDVSAVGNENSLSKKPSDVVDPKTVAQTDVKLVSSETTASVSIESPTVPSSSSGVTTGPVRNDTQSSTSLPVEDMRTKLLSSSINAGTSVVLTQMQPIEVKKVKLCPSLEKQATAMSSGVPMTLSSSAESPKLVPASSLVQNNAPTSSAFQDAPSTSKSSSSDSARETLEESEAPVCGADLEKKVKLNPVHSLTRKTVRRLTRADLETYLMEVTCELVFSKSEAGKYRRMYEEMKEISENKSMKLAHLVKQVSDLKAVVAKVVEDQKERRDIIPHRITRSVGLQLDYSNITNALKLRSKAERFHMISPTGNSSLSNNSLPNVERPQQQRWNRSTPSSTSNTVVTSSPNGAVTSPIKDATLSSSSVNRSPQRQLRAIHPKIPQNLQSSSSCLSGSNQPSAANEQANKSLGFIDITEESKVLNSGASIGMKRNKQTTNMMVANSQSPPVSTNVNINTIPNNQVPPQTLKVVQQHYGQPGNVYQQPGGAPRMISPVNMTPTTPVAAPRVAYLIPTTRPMQPQQRQLVLTSPASAPQIRSSSPASQVNSVQTMLVRPNAIVQVSTGAISSPSAAFIRTMPNNPIQALPAVKNPQQHATRVMSMQPRQPVSSVRVVPTMQHPAPLPSQPQPTVVNPNLKPIPRRPVLKLSKVTNGIVLSWNMTNNTPHEEIASYQLYAYQEGANTPPSPSLWKKVGDVKALPLPMACTLTQFADGHRYHFAVRALDVHGRVGEFSVPGTIDLFN